MTGPISRLARDAVSPTRPTIHAMARLPYMPPPVLHPIEDAGMPAAAMMPATPATRPSSSAMPTPGAISGPQAVFADDTSRNAIDTDNSAEPGHEPFLTSRPSSTRHPSTMPPPSRSEDPYPAALMPASPAQGPAPSAAAPGATAAADETGALARATPSSGFEPAQTSSAPPPQAHASDQYATRGTSARTIPDALLPPIGQGARSTLSSPAAASAQRTPAAAESATEVHVHIGRIEVTAVQAPAAPRPAARGGPQPMSLDEYLARRERSGS